MNRNHNSIILARCLSLVDTHTNDRNFCTVFAGLKVALMCTVLIGFIIAISINNLTGLTNHIAICRWAVFSHTNTQVRLFLKWWKTMKTITYFADYYFSYVFLLFFVLILINISICIGYFFLINYLFYENSSKSIVFLIVLVYNNSFCTAL